MVINFRVTGRCNTNTLSVIWNKVNQGCSVCGYIIFILIPCRDMIESVQIVVILLQTPIAVQSGLKHSHTQAFSPRVPGMSGLATIESDYPQNGINQGLLRSDSQMYRNWSLKSPGFVSFGTNLTIFGATPDTRKPLIPSITSLHLTTTSVNNSLQRWQYGLNESKLY